MMRRTPSPPRDGPWPTFNSNLVRGEFLSEGSSNVYFPAGVLLTNIFQVAIYIKASKCQSRTSLPNSNRDMEFIFASRR